MNVSLDVCSKSLNKREEELCGDTVEIVKTADADIIILSDGMGSGVKANILSTLTTRILGTMLKNGETIEDCVETIAMTLPICKVRQVAYSTFAILQIFRDGRAYLVEYDNPPMLLLRAGKRVEIPYEERDVAGKRVRQARFSICPEDVFVLMSDGVTHAGLGSYLDLGWRWENVATYMENAVLRDKSPRTLQNLLLQACKSLYNQTIRDDTSVCVCRARIPSQTCVMVGPPQNREQDRFLVDTLLSFEGNKVVCGGTTSKIVSKVSGRALTTQLDYITPEIPPVAKIEGVDLVTEGVVTMGRALELMRAYAAGDTGRDRVLQQGRDGAYLLAQLLVQKSTSVKFLVGRALNPAYDDPDMPLDLTMKLRLVHDIAQCLRDLDKQVTLAFF